MRPEAMAWAIESCVHASVILAVVLAAVLTLRRASASARHWMWSCGVVAALLSPLFNAYLPKWDIETVPGLERITSLASPTRWAEAGRPGDASVEDARRAGVAAQGTASSDLDSVWLVAVVWALGTAGMLLYSLLGVLASRRIRRSAGALPERFVAELRSLADLHAMRRPIDIAISDRTLTPLVMGMACPLVILPRDSLGWSSERLRVVLLHELAHVKRGDCIIQALARLICAAYWFNPLVWIALRGLLVEQERACDDFVLAAGTKPSMYASHLSGIARRARSAGLPAIGAASLAMAGRSKIESRVMGILDPTVRRSADSGSRIAGSAMVLFVTLILSMWQLRPAGATTVAANGLTSADPSVGRRLIAAAHEGRIGEVRLLLDQGTDVDAASDGWTALVAAAHQGRVQTVRLLLDRGADVNAESDGWTALIAAAHQGHEETAGLLLDRDADVNAAPDGRSAFDVASQRGRPDVVKLLVERGANVSARSSPRSEREKRP